MNERAGRYTAAAAAGGTPLRAVGRRAPSFGAGPSGAGAFPRPEDAGERGLAAHGASSGLALGRASPGLASVRVSSALALGGAWLGPCAAPPSPGRAYSTRS